MVSIYSKVLFKINLAIKEINAHMLIIFKILEETLNNTTMIIPDASFGTFLMK
jgi:hypothetical protein